MTAIEYTNEGGIASLTINNPPQNRLSNDVMGGFRSAIEDLSARNDTRVLLIKSRGDDFSFGGDISGWLDRSAEDFSSSIAQGVLLSNLMQDLPFPIVVAVQGHCLGGGFELTLRGDIIVAADNAYFGHSEATIGVFTFLGGVQRVAERVGRTRAIQWAMTAELIDAKTALDSGLVNEVVPKAELQSAADRWVEKLATSATLSHAAHKKLLRAWSNGGVEMADRIMSEMSGEILVSEDAQHSLVGAIEGLKAGQSRPEYPFKGK